MCLTWHSRISQVKDYLRPQRHAAWAVAVRRFETPPGHQAQVDWGQLGALQPAAERQKVWDLPGSGWLPESWIPPEHVLEMRTLVRLRKALTDERREWQQRL
jgi:hypothetical protein